ncbi:MAG: hypothetical protein KAU14_01670 [Thermoplasmata archaeon]|nr:hypothetical protein [Thermoplasmata archaeon]
MKEAADEFVESVLRPKIVEPEPEDKRFSYLVDIYTKWYRSYFYFYAKYHSPGPNAREPFFDAGFARMEYVCEDKFNLSYMRHTGKWWEIFTELSLEECLETIREMPHFNP